MLRAMGPSVGLVASDDLEHEVLQRDREQRGLKEGAKRVRLRPTLLNESAVGCDFLYCRVHRRHGTERLLKAYELDDWSTSIVSEFQKKKKMERSGGGGGMGGERGGEGGGGGGGEGGGKLFVYFLWGTDCMDQPITNSRMLHDRLPLIHQQDWRKIVREENRSKRGSLLSMLSPSDGSGSSGSSGSIGRTSTPSTSSSATDAKRQKSGSGGIKSMLMQCESDSSGSSSGTSSGTSSGSSMVTKECVGEKRKTKPGKTFLYTIGKKRKDTKMKEKKFGSSSSSSSGPFAIQAASTSGSRYETCFMCNQDILKSIGLAAHIREKHSELVN